MYTITIKNEGGHTVTYDNIVAYDFIDVSDCQAFTKVKLNEKHFEKIANSISKMDYLPRTDSENLKQIVDYAIEQVEE